MDILTILETGLGNIELVFSLDNLSSTMEASVVSTVSRTTCLNLEINLFNCSRAVSWGVQEIKLNIVK